MYLIRQIYSWSCRGVFVFHESLQEMLKYLELLLGPDLIT
jgi:hypothetical protein